MGLAWSSLEVLNGIDLSSIPKDIGLYKIVDAIRGRLLYVGESKRLRKRIKAHSLKTWGDDEPLVSYHVLDNDILDHQRREMETDLIGGYYAAFGMAPKFQYGKQ
jgi:hypothetical protein